MLYGRVSGDYGRTRRVKHCGCTSLTCAKPKKPKGLQVSWGRTALKDDLSSAPVANTKNTCLESQNSVEKNADRSKRKGQRASDQLNKLSNDSKTKKCAATAIKRKNYIWWKAKKSLFLPLSDKTHQAFGFGKPTKTFSTPTYSSSHPCGPLLLSYNIDRKNH